MKCTDKEQHELLVEIGKALTSGNDALVFELGKKLKSLENPAVRRIRGLDKYKEVSKDAQLADLTKTVYRIGIDQYYYTTLEEYTNMYNLPISKAKKHMEENAKGLIPIANVFIEHIKEAVFIYYKGSFKGASSYLEVCFEHDIHFEDLGNVIENKVLIDEAYTFKFAKEELRND